MEKGWTLFAVIQVASPSIPADSAILRASSNGSQERSNDPVALLAFDTPASEWRVGVNRMRLGSGIVSEAKAPGKARGSADGGTATWTVQTQVAVNKL